MCVTIIRCLNEKKDFCLFQEPHHSLVGRNIVCFSGAVIFDDMLLICLHDRVFVAFLTIECQYHLVNIPSMKAKLKGLLHSHSASTGTYIDAFSHLPVLTSPGSWFQIYAVYEGNKKLLLIMAGSCLAMLGVTVFLFMKYMGMYAGEFILGWTSWDGVAELKICVLQTRIPRSWSGIRIYGPPHSSSRHFYVYSWCLKLRRCTGMKYTAHCWWFWFVTGTCNQRKRYSMILILISIVYFVM